jgi:hypothetical protein
VFKSVLLGLPLPSRKRGIAPFRKNLIRLAWMLNGEPEFDRHASSSNNTASSLSENIRNMPERRGEVEEGVQDSEGLFISKRSLTTLLDRYPGDKNQIFRMHLFRVDCLYQLGVLTDPYGHSVAGSAALVSAIDTNCCWNIT